MSSLYDGQDVLNEIDPTFSENIRCHVDFAAKHDPFHVSANTDPKGDRSKRPQDQDPDMLLHVVKETDAGIVVRGAKYETAAAYANQAFTKPTLANRFDEIDVLVIYDDVLIPWENVLFYQHTRAAAFIRATLHRYSAFAFVLR